MSYINRFLKDCQELSVREHDFKEVMERITHPTLKDRVRWAERKIKEGIDWSKKDMYEGIGRPDLKPCNHPNLINVGDSDHQEWICPECKEEK
ncbi:hypothetical protein HY345_01715 [Candidatus Microgenomates bacterium]|nr:hypothetical protein [Candidatus Microgenomates bacterium]